MSRIPSDLQIGERIKVVMKTGEVDIVRFDGWVWRTGLLPGMNYIADPVQIGDKIRKESGWIARTLIGRIQRLPDTQS